MERFKRPPTPSTHGSSFSSQSRLRAAARAPGSGEHSLRYSLMREVLVRYMSPILLDSVLTRALEVRHLTPAALTEPELAELAADIMVGLRLFVAADRLPQLMLDLAELLEPSR
jgi:hypothetical protein